jgi:hypothetical protein
LPVNKHPFQAKNPNFPTSDSPDIPLRTAGLGVFDLSPDVTPLYQSEYEQLLSEEYIELERLGFHLTTSAFYINLYGRPTSSLFYNTPSHSQALYHAQTLNKKLWVEKKQQF